MQNAAKRHNNIAISLHWLMAFLIVGMLAIGKFMVSLDETSSLRFTLTQWHKTFGVLILLLAVGRLFWRVTHRSPAHPEGAPTWERFASGASHFIMYALLFIAPITGWMLVSVSPLNIDTLLFNFIPWPHLPWLTNLVDSTSAEMRYHQFHEIATGALIALLLLHVAAAMKHHFFDKDDVLVRMLPSREAETGTTIVAMVSTLLLGLGAALLAYTTINATTNTSVANAATNDANARTSEVMAVAFVTGEDTEIVFADSTVTAQLDAASPENNSLSATVTTATASSKNLQVQGSLPDADWFSSETHPQALFESSTIEPTSDTSFDVVGVLTIKGIEQTQEFKLQITDKDGQKYANGEFVVDRTAYQLGLDSQPDGDYVGFDVTISFQFSLD